MICFNKKTTTELKKSKSQKLCNPTSHDIQFFVLLIIKWETLFMKQVLKLLILA